MSSGGTPRQGESLRLFDALLDVRGDSHWESNGALHEIARFTDRVIP